MTLIGLGVDLIEVARIKRLGKNPRFLKKVFTAAEMKYCESRKNKWEHYAVRFAAKEAVWKAVGRTGIRWRDIGVERRNGGAPQVQLDHKRFGKISVLVSLSHTANYGAASAVAFKP